MTGGGKTGFPGAQARLSTKGNEWLAALLHQRIAQLPSLRRSRLA